LSCCPGVHFYRGDFVAGTVSVERDGVVDCLAGARVELVTDGEVVASAATDAFGDFKLDRLDADGARYVLRFEADGYEGHAGKVVLQGSVNVGEIRLAPSRPG